MEIGAALDHLELAANDPAACARFHAQAFRLDAAPCEGGGIECVAPGRRLRFVPGTGGQLRQAGFRFATDAGFQAQRERLRPLLPMQDVPGGCAVLDPLGHRIAFLAPRRSAPTPPGEPGARLQHFALRTPQPAVLAGFYADVLGFVVSDRVVDAQGELTAVFLRSDAEHHALALFRSPVTRFDHYSCEVDGWLPLRDWADHMAAVGVDLAWGVGRHGPGNDTFFMVEDPDGNMGEISAELEVCAPGRPAGVWPHRPQTLNRWGAAIMRG